MPEYTNWAPGEPNTVGPSYAYLNLHDGLWYDEIATATGHGTCEIRTASLIKIRGIIEDSMGLFFEKNTTFFVFRVKILYKQKTREEIYLALRPHSPLFPWPILKNSKPRKKGVVQGTFHLLFMFI